MAERRPADCELASVDTTADTIAIAWKRGEESVVTRIVASCDDDRLSLSEGRDELAASCPESLDALSRAIAGVVVESPKPLDRSKPNQLEPSAISPGPGHGWRWTTTAIVLGLAGCLALALIGRELWTAIRRRSPAIWAGLGLFSLALAIRFAVPISPSNWYTDLYRQSTDVGLRFGPGSLVLQAALWSITPPSDVLLARIYAIVGAASVPAFFAVLRARKVPWVVAISAAVFLAIMPAHARVSASWSEHVLTSSLLWLTVLAFVRGGLGAILASVVLVPAAVLIRYDAWVPLLMVPAWAVLRDENEATPTSTASWKAASLYVALWAGVGVAVYCGFIAAGSHPLPELSTLLPATLLWLPVAFGASVVPPFWLSPVLLFAIIGAVAMAKNRPRLLATVVLSAFISVAPLGRALLDLVSARYFLPVLAILTIPASFGLERALARFGAMRPWLVRGAVYVGALLAALPAYAARYTFQDEYDFLRRELSKVPADCTVVQVPVQHPSFATDLDCCLDPDRSPLRYRFPNLEWKTVADDVVRLGDGDDECVVYYESPACMLRPDPDWDEDAERVMAFYSERCAAIMANNELEPMATSLFAKRAIPVRDVFPGPPRGALHWVKRPSGEASIP